MQTSLSGTFAELHNDTIDVLVQSPLEEKIILHKQRDTSRGMIQIHS